MRRRKPQWQIEIARDDMAAESCRHCEHNELLKGIEWDKERALGIRNLVVCDSCGNIMTRHEIIIKHLSSGMCVLVVILGNMLGRRVGEHRRGRSLAGEKATRSGQ